MKFIKKILSTINFLFETFFLMKIVIIHLKMV